MTLTSSQLLSLVCVAALGTGALTIGCRPLGNAPPTRVESGLPYSSGQADFDAFFTEFHQAQSALMRAPDEERHLRRDFSAKLSIAAGATPQLLIDTVAARAKDLETKKTLLQLVVEGLKADDEADTLVQSQVNGPLDGPAKTFVESTTLLAREEVRLIARLRKLGAKLERLAMQAQALEPSLDSSFSTQGYSKYDEARRNLTAAKRNLPLMSLKTRELSESSTQFVNKLVAALTTDRATSQKTEPPLITTGPVDSTSKRPRAAAPNRARNGVPATAKPKTKPASTDSPGADFEP